MRDPTTCSAYSKVGSIVNKLSDFEEVEENSGVDWARTGQVVVIVCKTFEDFGRQLKPGPVE